MQLFVGIALAAVVDSMICVITIYGMSYAISLFSAPDTPANVIPAIMCIFFAALFVTTACINVLVLIEYMQREK